MIERKRSAGGPWSRWTCGILFVVLASVGVSDVDAQTRWIPQIGVYSAVNDPGSVRGVGGAYDIGVDESTVAFGAAVEFNSRRDVGFRLGGLYVPEAETGTVGFACTASCPLGSDLLSLTGALTVRPLGEVFFLEPYLVGGVAYKRYDFEPVRQSGTVVVFGDESHWGGVLGIGTELDLGGADLLLELSDHFHWSSKELPGGVRDRLDDFFFTVGVALGGKRHRGHRR